MMAGPVRDRWAEWLLYRRHGGDPEQQKANLDYLRLVRDRVLGNAGVREGETLLDLGAGDGLIAFGALDLVGESGRVIFSDISRDLLDHGRSLARELDVLDRCRFVRAPAEDLSVLESSSLDVVTTRSVLIYVQNKRSAFEESYRVLRSGGRLSIYEPINSFGYPEPEHSFWGYGVMQVKDLASKVRAVYHRHQPPETDTMMNFDESDLLDLAEDAGFKDVRLDYSASISSTGSFRWGAFVKMAWNPRMPTLEEAMDEALTPDEAERFTAHLRPLVERGRRRFRLAEAYLRAVKSG